MRLDGLARPTIQRALDMFSRPAPLSRRLAKPQTVREVTGAHDGGRPSAATPKGLRHASPR